MNLVFFIKSKTVDLTNYSIKNVPGSSGRLDVISRCILAALLKESNFDLNVKIWVFLDNYGTYIFSPHSFDYNNFPKNELRFTNSLVDILLKKKLDEVIVKNPLQSIQKSKMNFIEAIQKYQELNYDNYVLKEDGTNFFELEFNIKEKENILFILGSQEDNYLDSQDLLALNIPTISMGASSYLASSVIKLLKMHILEL
jgi:tRNA (pseudouridine54-N1)-methyltransferase